MNLVAFDIETKPGSPRPLADTLSEEEAIGILKAEAEAKWKTDKRQRQHYEDPDRIAATRVAQPDLTEWANESLNPLKGEVFCISACILTEDPADAEAVTFSQHKLGNEALVLKAFWKWIKTHNTGGKPRLSGWNCAEFDGPFIVWRAMKHDLFDMASFFAPTKWGDNYDDLMIWAKLGARGRMRKLDDVAEFFGLGGKQTLDDETCTLIGMPSGTKLDGSVVWRLLDAGLEDEVCSYCERDTMAVVHMYETVEYVTRRSR